MHVPEKWRLNEQSKVLEFIERYSFATLVSPSLASSQLPLILDRSHHCLIGHFARSNPHWCEFQNAELAQHLVIFNGPHDYTHDTSRCSFRAIKRQQIQGAFFLGMLIAFQTNATQKLLSFEAPFGLSDPHFS